MSSLVKTEMIMHWNSLLSTLDGNIPYLSLMLDDAAVKQHYYMPSQRPFEYPWVAIRGVGVVYINGT